MPTVEQVWRQAMPQETDLVAGEAGIYNEVSWVVTLRPTPPGFDRLRGNELALIDVTTVKGLGVTLSSLVISLAEQGVGALGILGEVTSQVREHAEGYKMPILQLPRGSDLGALQACITTLITEERSRLYQQEHKLTEELMELALAGLGVDAILDKLQDLSGRTALLLNPNFKLRTIPSDPKLVRLQKALFRALPSPPNSIVGLKLLKGFSGFLSPVSGKQRTEGYLLIVAPSEDIQEVDRLVAKVGSLALAVEMSRRQAVEDTEDMFQTEMFESLVSGDLSSSNAAERAAKLGLDLSRRYVVMIVQPIGVLKTEISVKRVKSVLGEKALCFWSGSSLIVLFEVVKHSIDDMRRLKEETAQKLASQLGVGISLGMGHSCIAADGLKAPFQEAEQALMIGKQLFGEGSASFFGDLGIYRLLLSIGVNELKSFYQESVGHLEEYDRAHGGELVRTLEEIRKYPTIPEAAQALHIHRNTLLYRIERMQEITTLNLDDGESRLTFHLALKARDVIRRS